MSNYRIMETNNFGDAIFYRAACHCTDEKCDLHLELEIDNELHMILMNIYKDLWFEEYWGTNNWFEEKWKRIKGALRLLFVGRLKISDTFIFGDVTQIRNFLDVLHGGMEQLEKNIKNDDKLLPQLKKELLTGRR